MTTNNNDTDESIDKKMQQFIGIIYIGIINRWMLWVILLWLLRNAYTHDFSEDLLSDFIY